MKKLNILPAFWGTVADQHIAPLVRSLTDGLRQKFGSGNVPGGQWFAADNMLLFDRACGFLGDPKFVSAFGGCQAEDDPHSAIVWRRHVECWAAQHCLNVPGAFVDCGAYKGDCCAMILDFCKFAETGKRYLLIDAYEPQEGKSNMPGLSAEMFQAVQARFRATPFVEVVRGFLPEVLTTIDVPEQIALLNVTLGLAHPTLSAISRLFDRVSPGGIVIIESYGYSLPRYAELRPMMDYWASSVGHMICELPTGQGLLIKH